MFASVWVQLGSNSYHAAAPPPVFMPKAEVMASSSSTGAVPKSGRAADPKKKTKKMKNHGKEEDGEGGEGTGVSAGPSALKRLHHGDPDAQELSAHVNRVEKMIYALHRSESFFQKDARRDLVMSLPTCAGAQVLDALLISLRTSTPEELSNILESLVMKKWAALTAAMDQNLGETFVFLPRRRQQVRSTARVRPV